MARPKKYELPDYMTFNRISQRWVVRNPISKKEKSWPESDRSQAEAAAAAVAKLVLVERQRRMLSEGRPTLAGLVRKWKEDRLPMMPWSEGTRTNYVSKMNRIERELGQRTVAHTDCMFIEDWISSFTKTADTFNDWRYVFVLLWKFAVSRKLITENEAAKIEERSTSKKIESNRKQRQPLDVGGFRLIHEKAGAWLQLAMEYSLVTLLARQAWTEFSCEGDYETAAKWLRKVADRLDGLAAQGKRDE